MVMNEYLFMYAFGLVTLTFLVLWIATNASREARKNSAHQRKMEEYRVYNIEKVKEDRLHEQTMRKIELEELRDTRNYNQQQLAGDREFFLEQKRIDSQNGMNMLQSVWPYIEKNNEHLLKMAQLDKPVDRILEDESITNLNIKRK